MTAVTFPFMIDAHGKVSATRDPKKINQDRVRSLLNTQVGDRPMRPKFGFDVESLVFDMGRVTDEILATRLQDAFQAFLPDLHFVDVTRLVNSEHAETETLLVRFNGPDGQTDTATVNFSDGIVTSDPYSNSEVTL